MSPKQERKSLHIDERLHSKLRIKAAKSNTTVKALVERAILELLVKNAAGEKK